MIIECLVRRVGPTPVILEKTKYMFMPLPDAREGEESTSICDVTSETHLQYMLDPKRVGNYRKYDRERSRKELEEARHRTNLFIGFSVQKYLENGYILVDMRIPKKQRFADITGNWFEKRLGLSPWATEMEAYQWLKEEVEAGLIEPVTPVLESSDEKRGPGRPKRVDETISKVTGP